MEPYTVHRAERAFALHLEPALGESDFGALGHGHNGLQMTYDVYGGLVNLHDPVMAQAMANALLVAGQSIQPRFEPATVRASRPGGRGESRRRAS